MTSSYVNAKPMYESPLDETMNVKYVVGFLLENWILVVLRVFHFSWAVHFLRLATYVFCVTVLCKAVVVVYAVFLLVRGSGTFEFVAKANKGSRETLSPVNWAAPELFGDSDEASELLREGIRRMRSRESGGTAKADLQVAAACVLMSAVMYERTLEPGQQDAKIQQFAEQHDMTFKLIEDDKGRPGASFGLFVPKNGDCVVVAFKGTTPMEFNEWLIDASLQQTYGRSFVAGRVHRGFFRRLFGQLNLVDRASIQEVFTGDGIPASKNTAQNNDFRPSPQNEAGENKHSFVVQKLLDLITFLLDYEIVNSDDNDECSPYSVLTSSIRETVRTLAEQRRMAGNETPLVNVWVTGHSLGAALATLFFARLLLSPKDIAVDGCDVRLRDAYTFGNPRVGDHEFAEIFFNNSRSPIARSSRMWRFVNGKDIVCYVPVGISNPDLMVGLEETSLLTYVHVGEAVRIRVKTAEGGLENYTAKNVWEKFAAAYRVIRFALRVYFYNRKEQQLSAHPGDARMVAQERAEQVVRANHVREEARTAQQDMEKALPAFIVDHYANRYFYAIKQAIESAPNSVPQQPDTALSKRDPEVPREAYHTPEDQDERKAVHSDDLKSSPPPHQKETSGDRAAPTSEGVTASEEGSACPHTRKKSRNHRHRHRSSHNN